MLCFTWNTTTIGGMCASLESTPKQRPRIKPRWKKGESGNPAGRPKNILREALRKKIGVDRIAQVITDAIEARDSRILVAILDREWPRPPAGVELSGPDGGPVHVAGARDQLIERLKRRDGAT